MRRRIEFYNILSCLIIIICTWCGFKNDGILIKIMLTIAEVNLILSNMIIMNERNRNNEKY